MVLKRANRDAYQMFWKMGSQPHPVDLGYLEVGEDFKGVDVQKWAVDVYDSLSMIMAGDALAIARGTHDMNGLASWRRVYQRYTLSSSCASWPQGVSNITALCTDD